MNDVFSRWTSGFSFSGDVRSDACRFLRHHRLAHVAAHSSRVSREARSLTERFGVNPDGADIAGLLHDISAVIPNSERVHMAQALRLEVLPEEERFPMIVHQKLSKVMARELFGVTDTSVLEAIGCHTTLRAGASPLDLVLFVADKIEWDQPGSPPYLAEVIRGLERSLENAAFAYIRHLWEQREKLKVIHPWLADAYRELAAKGC
jgi:predicted HD superfamily hydrolase involved in NAD metabolism